MVLIACHLYTHILITSKVCKERSQNGCADSVKLVRRASQPLFCKLSRMCISDSLSAPLQSSGTAQENRKKRQNMQRDEFYQRVRIAAQSGRAYRVAPVDVAAMTAGYVGGGEDLCQKLALEINLVGGFAQVVASETALRDSVREILLRYNVRRALCWEHPLLKRLRLDELLAELKIEQWNHARLAPLSPGEQRKTMLAAEIGITSATYAIAETGSLVMASGAGTERSASLLPPVHLAIVEKSQILPDLFDLFTQLATEGLNNLASNVTLITGPSKTGDIELQLTTGVHGPGKWEVVIGEGSD